MVEVKRFWCPVGSDYNLSYNGYLDDPDIEYGFLVNPNIKTFDQISDINCLILLGEPGIGKSTCLEKEKDLIYQKLGENDSVLWFDLRSYGSEDRFIKVIFENETFKQWLDKENGNLYLFLDGLDECLLRINHCSNLIIDELKKINQNIIQSRLFLRIICRTAEKPNILVDNLQNIYGEEKFSEYELTPLRRKDIEIISKQLGIIDIVKFIVEIEGKQVVPLAIKPITLKFLVNLFIKHGQFPTNRFELYKQGCLQLCQEQNPSRVASRETGKYSEEKRLHIASRIAFCTIFANKYAILNDRDDGSSKNEIIKIIELKGIENFDNHPFSIDQEAIKETLSTGLFSSKGSNLIGFAHQTYAEFLAAEYLINKKVTLDKVISMLTYDLDGEKKVYPQFHQTILGLADLNSDFINWIVDFDPIIIFNQNYSLNYLTEASKKYLLKQIFNIIEENKSYERPYNLFSCLYYPGIDVELKQFIENTDNILAKLQALNIARYSKVKELEEYILFLAFDSTQDIQIRDYSIVYLKEIGSEESLKKLINLLPVDQSKDPDDNLKGVLFYTLYPKGYITTKQVFDWLTYPQKDHSGGDYRDFLDYILLENIKINDLPIALKWLENENINDFDKKNTTNLIIYPFNDFIQNVIKLVFENIVNVDIFKSLADLLLIKLKTKDYQFFQLFKCIASHYNDSFKILLKTLIPCFRQNNITPFDYHLFLHLSEIDIIWLANELNNASNKNYKENINDLLKYYETRGHYSSNLHADKQNTSEQKENVKHKLLDPPPAKIISDILGQIELGNIEKFWFLCRYIPLKEDSQKYEDWYSDIISQPGWLNSDDVTKQRIIKAAKSFIKECEISNPDYLFSHSFNIADHAFYKAVKLLYSEDISYLYSIDSTIWKKLIYIIINSFCCFHGLFGEIDKGIIKLAYKVEPEAFKEAVSKTINDSNVYHNIDFILDDSLKSFLYNKLINNEYNEETSKKILEKLILFSYQPAIEFLKQEIEKNKNETTNYKQYIAIGLFYGNTDLWNYLWPKVIESPEKHSKEIIIELAKNLNLPGVSFFEKLSVNNLKELYIKVLTLFPEEEKLTSGELTIDYHISEIKRAYLNRLKSIGTLDSIKALKEIVQLFPRKGWLNAHLEEAKQILLQKTYPNNEIKNLLKLVENDEYTLVNNINDLQDIIIKSLENLEKELQGGTPQSKFLWDSYKMPKPENDLSDYIKSHLEKDLIKKGIILNREVQIRNINPSGIGDKTDIQIDAVIKNNQATMYETINLIIEVKGCWHTELKTAMESQLCNTYLKPNYYSNGIYLVCWFNYDKWDDSDYKKNNAKKHFTTIDEARSKLRVQAKSLSTDGIRISVFVLDCSLQ